MLLVRLRLSRAILAAGLWLSATMGRALEAPGSSRGAAARLSDPAVDRFNVRVGTQTFGPKYQFTTNSALVETAEAIRGFGSDIIKFQLGRGVAKQYGITLPGTVTNLSTLARDEPSCRQVLDMPFRHFLIWAYCFASTSDAWWKDGFSAAERQQEYDEIYALARHLLTQYDRSGRASTSDTGRATGTCSRTTTRRSTLPRRRSRG